MLNSVQTQAILDVRLKEELNTTLLISVYDVDRNEQARKHKQEMVSRADLYLSIHANNA